MKVQIEPEIKSYSHVIYESLMSVLQAKKCKIYQKRVRRRVKKKRSEFLRYGLVNESLVRKMDMLIVFSPYATSHKMKAWSRKYKKPMLHLEAGFLPNSILCDMGGFWGESLLHCHMSHVIDDLSNDKNHQWSQEYSRYLINNNKSKRKQPGSNSNIKGDFIFLPMQYMRDQSVLKFGNMPYPRFMKRVASFCAKNKIILAVKKHPHAYRKEIKAVNKLLSLLKKKHGKYFQVVDGSVHWLCQNSLFMAGMNTGSIIDGLVNNCIISHCGQSIFENSGAVVHDNEVHRGLQRCLSLSDHEKITLRYRQNILIYYLYNRYLLLEEDTHNSEYSNEQKICKQMIVAN